MGGLFEGVISGWRSHCRNKEEGRNPMNLELYFLKKE